MECPRCNKRIKRLRTIDKGKTVIRNNECSKCGERFRTIEVYLVEFETERMNKVKKIIQAENKAEQLELDLDTIKTAFKTLYDAVKPLEEPKDEQEPSSFLPARYTRNFRRR